MTMFSREQSLDGLAAIRNTLEAAGVEFIEENDGGPVVRLQIAAQQKGQQK